MVRRRTGPTADTETTAALLESLEPRRLFAYDLQIGAASAVNLPTKPSQVTRLTLPIANFGDFTVTSTFTLEVKLVPTAYLKPGQLPDFFSSAAVGLKTIQVTQDFPPSGAWQEYVADVTIPPSTPAGHYAIVARVDGSDVLAETNESNNYFATGEFDLIGADGRVLVAPGDGDDSINLLHTSVDGTPVTVVTVNGVAQTYADADVTGFDVRGGGGNDVIVVTGGIANLTIDGNDGNDKIVGGLGNETLVGGAGKDTLFGGGGNDRLNGNGGNDRLYGEAGADRLHGYAGNDYLDGGSSADRLEGGDGADLLFGQSGSDRFFTRDLFPDSLFGATGTDTGNYDVLDSTSSIERTA